MARAIADKELADVVIIDIADQKAAGVALDMFEACPIEGSDSRVVGYGANDEGWGRPPTPTSSSSRRACRASRA